MKGNMITITKWNNWRNASIQETNIVDNCADGVYFFSANAFGLKGKIPGGKHSWCSIRENSTWTTFEITDIETIEVQDAKIIKATSLDKQIKQIIVSNRNPATTWFGNKPKLIYYSPAINDISLNMLLFPCKINYIKLYKNNCNTYFSYLLWACNIKLNLKYIGFKSYKYWDKLYNV